MTRCSLGKFLVFPTLSHQATPHMQTRQIPAAKDGIICGEGCPVVLHKWPISRYLGICFWFSKPVLVQTKFFLSECSTYSLSLPCMRLDHDSFQVTNFVYMRKTFSVAVLNMGLKLEMNWSNWYFFLCVCILYVLKMSSKYLTLSEMKYV